ncbi:MAG: hypothetical protein ACMUIL_04535 [bacterium]
MKAAVIPCTMVTRPGDLNKAQAGGEKAKDFPIATNEKGCGRIDTSGMGV